MHVKWVALVDHDKLGDGNDADNQDQEQLNQNRYTRFLGIRFLKLYLISTSAVSQISNPV